MNKLFAVAVLSLLPLLVHAAAYVDIIVYDGTDSPATAIAGCSGDCTFTGMTPTGTVTHSRNSVGWGFGGSIPPGQRIHLYIDGRREDSASSTNPSLMRWNAGADAAGPHLVQAVMTAADGSPVTSAPLYITVVK